MKVTVLLALLIATMTSCTKTSESFVNSPSEYWAVYALKDCHNPAQSAPQFAKPSIFERWIFKPNHQYELYIYHKDSSVHLSSRSGRDYIVEQSWQSKPDSLLLDGGLDRFSTRKVTSDSIVLTMKDYTCVSWNNSEKQVSRMALVLLMVRRKGNVIQAE